MPPLIALALLGVGVYTAGRFIVREMARVGEYLDEAGREPKPIEIKLEKDPRSGVYQYRDRR